MAVSGYPLVNIAASAANSPFIMVEGRTASFSEFHAHVEAMLCLPSAKILPAKSVVLLPVEKSLQSLLAFFAVMRAGNLVVPVDKNTPPTRFAYLQKSVQNTLTTEMGEHACLGVFTSGSTGEPKLALHSWQTLLANATAANTLIPLQPGDRTLLSLPLNHIGGIAQVLRALVSATTLVIGGRVEHVDVLASLRITHTSMVPTQLQRLLALKPKLPLLKSVLLGGGPISEELITEARKSGIPVMPTYGMTETASQVLTEISENQQVCVGDSELKLTDTGELCIRSASLFLGYWQNAQLLTARDTEGWFKTGDKAECQSGKWRICGRVDNQFVSGGKNIQPEEIERHLKTLPTIQQSVVVPVPDKKYGHVAFAFVQRFGALNIDSDFQHNTITALKKLLPGYLVPRHFAQLPEPQGMKIKRQPLIQRAIKVMSP